MGYKTLFWLFSIIHSFENELINKSLPISLDKGNYYQKLNRNRIRKYIIPIFRYLLNYNFHLNQDLTYKTSVTRAPPKK